MNVLIMGVGAAMISAALTPTPDDVLYVIPPVGAVKDTALFTLGMFMLGFGLISKESK